MRNSHAFTLVELSIVLVILGLLVGGVLTGQPLIRAAELRSVTTDQQRYAAAAQTFRSKYFAVPGDMSNATRFWGRLNGNADCVTNSAASVSATTGVCDGNADGSVVWDNGGAGGAAYEMHQFWRQLASAGLIEGTYTGISGSNRSSDVIPGTNAPRSRISNAGWGVGSGNSGSTNSFSVTGGYSNYLVIGSMVSGNNPIVAVFKPEEAWNIDTKIDDGKPATGKTIGYAYSGCTTATSTSDLAAVYNLTWTSAQCALYFNNQF